MNATKLVQKKEEKVVLLERRRKKNVDYNEKSIWTKAVVLSSEEDGDYEEEEEEENGASKKKGRPRSKSYKSKTVRPIEKLKDDELRSRERNQNLLKRLYMVPWKQWDEIRLMSLRT